jgi:Transposase, Mutator family
VTSRQAITSWRPRQNAHAVAANAASSESWADLLRDGKRRGMRAPVPAVEDGDLGFSKAIRDVFPDTAEQRCWRHKIGNLRRRPGRAPNPPATTNPIESTLATVRLRQRITKGPGPRAGIAMACKRIESAPARWRAVNASHLVAQLRAGARFENGNLVERPDQSGGEAHVA